MAPAKIVDVTPVVMSPVATTMNRCFRGGGAGVNWYRSVRGISTAEREAAVSVKTPEEYPGGGRIFFAVQLNAITGTSPRRRFLDGGPLKVALESAVCANCNLSQFGLLDSLSYVGPPAWIPGRSEPRAEFCSVQSVHKENVGFANTRWAQRLWLYCLSSLCHITRVCSYQVVSTHVCIFILRSNERFMFTQCV